MSPTVRFAVALLLAAHSPAGATRSVVAAVRLAPAKATGIATASGSIQGDAFQDYAIRAGAGQTLTIDLKAGSPSAYFNVLPPGSSDVAMFIGSASGAHFGGTVPITGDYVARVYLMRSAARKGAASSFTLDVRVTGTALAPLSPSKDAVIPGTSFHAKATVRCGIPYHPDVHECEAWAVRYGADGTATVELRGPKGFVRRILFVKGTPSASDATERPAFTRTGDMTTVRMGADEFYELPDALVVGG